MPHPRRSITAWLSEEEYRAISVLALKGKRPVARFVAELLRAHLLMEEKKKAFEEKPLPPTKK